jgi:FtsH-binding integral membrane protein
LVSLAESMDVERSALLGADAQQGDNAVFVRQCNDKSLPAQVRIDFIKKTYGLLTYMLLITFFVALPFVLRPVETKTFFFAHPAILVATSAIFLCMYAVNFCLITSTICGDGSFVSSYIKMFKTFPQNYIFLTVISMAFGVMTGFCCMQYKAESVLLVFLMTASIIVCLSIYAVRTQADFTGSNMYFMGAICGLMMTSMFCMLFPGPFTQKIVAGMGSILFAALIIRDTQMIFGEVEAQGAMRSMEYTIDMYAFAAYQLYLDFINFFLDMLRLLGERN